MIFFCAENIMYINMHTEECSHTHTREQESTHAQETDVFYSDFTLSLGYLSGVKLGICIRGNT